MNNSLVLICGIGTLAQTCIERLLETEAKIKCINENEPKWLSQSLKDIFGSSLVLGDMREPSILVQAEIANARSILFLSSNPTNNLEAALQARVLNPEAAIVVRSTKQQGDINHLIESKIPNLVIIDPHLLTAGATAQSLASGENDLYFQMEGQSYRFISTNSDLFDYSSRHQRELCLQPNLYSNQKRIILSESSLTSYRFKRSRKKKEFKAIISRIRKKLNEFKDSLFNRLKNLQLYDYLVIILLSLLLIGTLTFSFDKVNLQTGVFVTVALLKGEFVDPVNVLIEESDQSVMQFPLFVLLITLIYAIIGTILTSLFVALILDQILSRRLGLRRRDRPRRGVDSVLLVDGMELNQLVARLLQSQGIGVLHVDTQAETGLTMARAIKLVRKGKLIGAALLCKDLISNLRIALELQTINPQLNLSIVTKHLSSSQSMSSLLGGISLISTTDIAADAIIATAFGETVEQVIRFQGRNLLVVKYSIEQSDTLHGLSVSRLEEGYGITVIGRRTSSQSGLKIFPARFTIIEPGDELFIVADLAGVQRIDSKTIVSPRWSITFSIHNQLFHAYEIQQCFARLLNKAPGEFLSLLDGQSHTIDSIDYAIAMQLKESLRKYAIRAEVTPMEHAQHP
ncbi:putative potassium transporter [Synechococcus sp. PROS-7-1]|uniref:NAD-binding protein n=1 Tax=Synechococcus sp. PROS-7-1 TaxID=1442556 RepID=UPI00164881D5|nr:NAD-binding protein [Synechococcus sp. PROS-7-1]QNI85228.1 putative potassium transporter [Synechococcus sp. PROS-7-1]